VELAALLMFWVFVFYLRDIAEPEAKYESVHLKSPGRSARHPHAWAEFTKTHVV
jgi:hypothetical protein